MSTQDSDGLTANERQHMDELTAADDEDDDSLMPPPVAKEPTPDYLNKDNHPALANPAGTGLPLQPIREMSAATSAANQLGGMGIDSQSNDGAPSAAEAESASAAPAPAGKPAAGKPETLSGGESTSEASDDELTPEEQKKAEHVKNVEAVIADTEAAGFTFGPATKFAAAEMYVNNKQLFDDANLDITACVPNSRKSISKSRVEEKLAELRAAERQRQTAAIVVGGMSQAFDNDSEDEKSQLEDEMSEDGFDGMSKTQLEARKDVLATDKAVAEAKLAKNPVKLAYRVLKKEMEENSEEINKEYEDIKQYYFVTFFETKKFDEFTLYQLQYFSRMLNAEIEKRELPVAIELASKDLKNIDTAIEQLDIEELKRKNDKRDSKRNKRARDAAAAVGASSSSTPARSQKRRR